MDKKSPILILGGSGLVGQGLSRVLKQQGYKKIYSPSSGQINLTNRANVHAYFQYFKGYTVFMCAALSRGAHDDTCKQSKLLADNALMAINTVEACYKFKVKRLIYMGSSAVNGPQTAYAMAKSLGAKLCELYRKDYESKFQAVHLTNIYGPGDNFSLDKAHLVAGLMHRMHLAKKARAETFEVGCDGSQLRQFMYVDDLAERLIETMYSDDLSTRALWGGEQTDIMNLATTMSWVIGFKGKLVFNQHKTLYDQIYEPGASKTALIDGLENTYSHFLNKWCHN